MSEPLVEPVSPVESIPEALPVPEPEPAPAPVEPELAPSVEPPELTPSILAALAGAVAAPPGGSAFGAPPVLTEETTAQLRIINETLHVACPRWAWSCWPYIPSGQDVIDAALAQGLEYNDELLAKVQAVNWDAHYEGKIPENRRRVAGRSLLTFGPPDGAGLAEAIAAALDDHAAHWSEDPEDEDEDEETIEAAAARNPPFPPGTPPAAWACGHCGWLAQGTPENPIPATICGRCGLSDSWRQPTMAELTGRAIPTGSGVENPTYTTSWQRTNPNTQPDDELDAIVTCVGLLNALSPRARRRVLDYIVDRDRD